MEEEDSTLSLVLEGKGSKARLIAHLTDADDATFGIADRPIALFGNGEQIGSGVTDGAGQVVFEVPSNMRGRNNVFEAVFDGGPDPYYRGSNATTRS